MVDGDSVEKIWRKKEHTQKFEESLFFFKL